MTASNISDAQSLALAAGSVDYEAVFAQAPAPFLLLTPDLVIVTANQARLEATATTLPDTVGRHLFEVFPVNPDDPDADGVDNLRTSLARARDTKRPVTMPVQKYDIAMPDGSWAERYWSPRNVPILDEHGEVVLLLHRADDITDYIRDRDDARLEAARGAHWRERVEQVESDLYARAQQLHEVNRQLQEANRQLRQARDELAVRALHDPLTGLLVRSVLLEHLGRALVRLRRHPGDVAVLFVDLDGLKQANDTRGHAAGDALIRCCAQHLQQTVRPSDTVARIGGDEFVIVLHDLEQGSGLARAQDVAQRLLQALDAPCQVVPDVLVHLSASIGIAVASSTSTSTTGDSDSRAGGGAPPTVEELLSRADTAMYQAKRAGGRRYQVFDETVHQQLTARRRLELQLREALAEHRLRVHYQPIVDLTSGETVAVEALLRWQHPDGRLPAAAEFIDVAEQAGLLPAIGAWVRTQACRQLAAWDLELGERAPQQMFLNLSPDELTQPRLPQELADTARHAGIDTRRLVLEVTETGILDAADSTATHDALRHLGCQLAIDDFGTGFSSLSRLVQLPATVLKIDRSFLRDLHRDQQSVAVIAAVLTLAHNLRKTVIAEGVEDPDSLATLLDVGCTHAQGYHLAEPQPPDQLAAHLSRPPAAPAAGPGRPGSPDRH